MNKPKPNLAGPELESKLLRLDKVGNSKVIYYNNFSIEAIGFFHCRIVKS